MIIKQSPQDFVVEEITLDGEVLEVGKEYSFSGGEGEHLVFVLEKTNWATMGAMKEYFKIRFLIHLYIIFHFHR